VPEPRHGSVGPTECIGHTVFLHTIDGTSDKVFLVDIFGARP
jgi:hypothetical protein